MNTFFLLFTLHCQVWDATVLVHKSDYVLPENSKVSILELKDFRIQLNTLPNQIFEIEVLDSANASRTYSQAKLEHKNDFIKWSIWSRSAMIDVDCALNEIQKQERSNGKSHSLPQVQF